MYIAVRMQDWKSAYVIELLSYLALEEVKLGVINASSSLLGLMLVMIINRGR